MHKRKYKRVIAKALATGIRAGDKFAAGLVVANLSLGGAFIRSADPMSVGSPVLLDFARPGLKRGIRLTGRVVSIITRREAREEGCFAGMGVSFDPLEPDTEARLVDLMAVMAPGDDARVGDEAPGPLLEAELEPEPEIVGTLGPPEHGKDVLMVQVTGLLMELGELNARVRSLEDENERLRAQLAKR